MAGSTRRSAPKWWQFPWWEIASFLLGAFLLVWETVAESSAQPIVVGAGLALCGVIATGGVQRALKRATGGR